MSTAYVGWHQMQGKLKIPFVWYKRLAGATIILALAHALLAIGSRLGW